ncbi:MAG TPA: hypothetical protein VKU89_07310 [Solirubrobacteraceae bacterium]|nr:hypothetical protein [Solirubrobacteraceae bacterium]
MPAPAPTSSWPIDYDVDERFPGGVPGSLVRISCSAGLAFTDNGMRCSPAISRPLPIAPTCG